jgi:hypothetical protein
MRVLPAALAISAVVHAVAIGWAATRKHPEPQANPFVMIVPTPRVEPEPIAIDLVDDGRGNGPGHVGVMHTRLATSRPHVEVPATRPPPAETHSPEMAMRHTDLAISGDFIEQFLSRPAPVAPAEPPNPIEGERIEDEITATRRNLGDPSWLAHASPDEVSAARKNLVALYDARDAHELKRDGDGYKAEHDTFVAHVDHEGTVKFEDKSNWQQKDPFHANFDATDAIMRHIGQDPYASAKQKFLDDTRDERYEIGKRYKRQQLARSKELALKTLDWIWQTTRDLRERKQAVFELWDDCAESGDADLVAGGRDAREMIATFVQSHLTGADAYTPDELAAFNAHKTSTATFAPYAP